MLIDHNIVRFEIPVKNTELLVEVLHPQEDLLYDHFNLSGLIELHEAFLALLLDILSEAHVHLFEHNE